MEAMKKNILPIIDLHSHTNCSDGQYSPEEIVALAEKTGLFALAITDHDTMAGVQRALEASKNHAVEVVPGVEVSAEGPNGLAIHIVGLFVDHNDPNLNRRLDECKNERYHRLDKIIARLDELNMPLSREKILSFAGSAAPARPHIAQAMIEMGYVQDNDEAFEKYLSRGKIAYVDRDRLDCKETAQLIRGAGGIPILAHPCYLWREGLVDQQVEELILDMKEGGPLGIEILYSDHTVEETAKAAALAEKFGLIPSGGSDFHGSTKSRIQLGRGLGNLVIGLDILKKLKSAREQQDLA